ncbi:MAG: PaaI family thioesterase [Pyrinomonadaceae bacterium]|nr:PaaI family thioesterase [Pyrinomonadaceae bacterium]
MNEPLTEVEEQRLRERFQSVSFARLLKLELVELRRGTCILNINAREELSQLQGFTHGGALATLADTAAAFAVQTLLKPEERTVTVDLTIHFLRPLVEGRATARARVLRAGKRLLTVSVEICDPSSALISIVTTTYTKLM